MVVGLGLGVKNPNYLARRFTLSFILVIMLIIPAIDLYKGKVVRLTRGSKSECKVYSLDPLSVAKSWIRQGASWLHLVDLSAAFSEGNNRDIILKIKKELKVSIQTGGGIRSLDEIKNLVEGGIDRLILGTSAVNLDFLKSALDLAGSDKIAVAVDEKNNKVAVEGWQKNSDFSIPAYLDYLKSAKVKRVVYTDTEGDGMLQGVNLAKAKILNKQDGLNFIFSGGVSSLADIKNLRKIFSSAEGVIVGKALYENKFSLEEAIALSGN